MAGGGTFLNKQKRKKRREKKKTNAKLDQGQLVLIRDETSMAAMLNTFLLWLSSSFVLISFWFFKKKKTYPSHSLYNLR